MTRTPPWFALSVDVFDHPKLVRIGPAETVLWMRGLAYSTKHLTDGWVPLPLPRQWGYAPKHSDQLVAVGLWHPIEVTDDGGWLINDYRDWQITREEWQAKTEQRRSAARKRWAR